MYEKEIEALSDAEKDLDKTKIEYHRTLHSELQLQELRQRFHGIPEDYLTYLAEVGEGSIGDELYTVFGELMDAEDFFDEQLHEFLDFDESVLLFGCDFSGNGLIFLPDEDWMVGIIYHDDMGEVERTEKDFRSYISEVILSR